MVVSLRDLSMNHNEVTKYIHHTKIFHNLQTLFLQHNKITSLYDLSDLTKLPLLQRIELQGNNLNMEGINAWEGEWVVIQLLQDFQWLQ